MEIAQAGRAVTADQDGETGRPISRRGWSANCALAMGRVLCAAEDGTAAEDRESSAGSRVLPDHISPDGTTTVPTTSAARSRFRKRRRR